MNVLLIANPVQREELTAEITSGDVDITYVEDLITPSINNFDFCIDLQFTNTVERKTELQKIKCPLYCINHVTGTLADLPAGFIRINGWNSLLGKKMIEASTTNENARSDFEKLLLSLGKTVEWVPDVPGFISCRVICQIINEAYFSLEEEVSTKDQIDIAMKLGTNYPHGPFEWSEIIGLDNVAELLSLLSKSNTRYQPSKLLLKESVE